jgi:hypothetical protein
LVLCCALAGLGYRRTQEANSGLRDRMRNTLQAKLDRVRRDFNGDLADAVNALTPPGSFVDADALERAMLAHLDRDVRMFRRIAIAIPGEYLITLRMFDMGKRRFAYSEWPEDWKSMNAELRIMLLHRDEPVTVTNNLVFARAVMEKVGGREIWVVFELNLPYLRDTLLPEILQHDLGTDGSRDYQVEVADVAWSAVTRIGSLIYRSDPAAGRIGDRADGFVAILQPQFLASPGPRWSRNGEPQFGVEVSRWILRTRHKAGGLDAAVARVRWRGFAAAAGGPLLLIASYIALTTLTRRAAARRIAANS